MAFPLAAKSSPVPWHCFLPRATLACSCAAVFAADTESRHLWRMCLALLSPLHPYSWHAHSYSPLH
jgi:hypothetical protein